MTLTAEQQAGATMVIVEAPLDRYPHSCIATGKDTGEFIDTGMEHKANMHFESSHVYLSRGWLEALAVDHCGMAPRKEVEVLRKRVKQLEAEHKAFQNQINAVKELEEVLS